MKKNDEDLEAQLAEADHRRKALEDEKTKKLAAISGLEKIEKVELTLNPLGTKSVSNFAIFSISIHHNIRLKCQNP